MSRLGVATLGLVGQVDQAGCCESASCLRDSAARLQRADNKVATNRCWMLRPVGLAQAVSRLCFVVVFTVKCPASYRRSLSPRLIWR